MHIQQFFKQRSERSEKEAQILKVALKKKASLTLVRNWGGFSWPKDKCEAKRNQNREICKDEKQRGSNTDLLSEVKNWNWRALLVRSSSSEGLIQIWWAAAEWQAIR